MPSHDFDTSNVADAHFRLAESQFFRMCGPHASSYVVEKVRYCVNPSLMARYDAKRLDLRMSGAVLREGLMFHGTARDTIDKILREGFKIGGQGVPVATGTALGTGVYVSEDPQFAMRYIRDSHTQLLFARVLITDDCTIRKESGVIQQLVVKNIDQLLPCYVVHFRPR